jgi:hypothetical protein
LCESNRAEEGVHLFEREACRKRLAIRRALENWKLLTFGLGEKPINESCSHERENSELVVC